MTLIVYSIMKIYSDDHNTLQNFILIDKFNFENGSMIKRQYLILAKILL